MGKTLQDFGLESLVVPADEALTRTKDIADALDAPIPNEYVEAIATLNNKQHETFTAIMSKVNSEESGVFFIDGPRGTGKTYLYCALYAAIRQMGKIVLPTATSGIAASNMVTGRTARLRFKLPLDHTMSMACNVSKQSGLADLLKASSLIIWDEASMALKQNIESLDLLLRDLCEEEQPFGGKVVVFGGDFRQVLPVVPKKSQKEAVEASLVSSHLWKYFTRIRLSENMRARSDPLFSDFLLALGNGELQETETGNIQIPEELLIPFEEEGISLPHLIKEVFPELSKGHFSPEIFTDHAILTPLNDDVDEINNLLIENHPGEAAVYKSFDSLIDDSFNIYTTEFLNTLCPGGMSPHSLVLK
ncbi:ATP-dependent DNA helicase PIF2-like [Chenopodium quinoa]|uniref:ATP-dependent DNA helicase PIF2-like n=1 Tax=Chenopodium quinoa TaxID=63459 RepID=UPI000B78261C|nr:ATP-dependent DNA helicase PIF2-like [Chenopodium quinoa]